MGKVSKRFPPTLPTFLPFSPMRLYRYFQFGEFFQYFLRVFRKPDPRYPHNFNLRMMHGINRISIVMFAIALVVIITRAIIRSL